MQGFWYGTKGHALGDGRRKATMHPELARNSLGTLVAATVRAVLASRQQILLPLLDSLGFFAAQERDHRKKRSARIS